RFRNMGITQFVHFAFLLLMLLIGIGRKCSADVIRSIDFPLHASQTSVLTSTNQSPDGVHLLCNIQNLVSGSRDTKDDSGYNFLHCKMIETPTTTSPITTSQQVDTTVDDRYKDTQFLELPNVGASTSRNNCSIDISENDVHKYMYMISEQGLKVVRVIIRTDNKTEPTYSVVWVADAKAHYLMNNLLWYRLFSLIPISLSQSDIIIHSKVTGHCEDPDVMKKNIQTALKNKIQGLIFANMSYSTYGSSLMCFTRTDIRHASEDIDNEYSKTYTLFSSGTSEEIICCPIIMRDDSQCYIYPRTPKMVHIYRILLYIIWWVIIFPIVVLIPFHVAYCKVNADGEMTDEGMYYKINDIRAMLLSVLCESRAFQVVVFGLVIVAINMKVLTEYHFADIPGWAYLTHFILLSLFPIIKLIWEKVGTDLDFDPYENDGLEDLSVKRRKMKRVYKHLRTDTLFGLVELPTECQLGDAVTPLGTAIADKVFYRARLLLDDAYWRFCCVELFQEKTNKVNRCVTILLKILTGCIMVFAAILNALPVTAIVSTAIVLLRRQRHLSRKWRMLICIAPFVGLYLVFVHYTILQFFFHTTSIPLLDTSTFPILMTYIFIFHNTWESFSQMREKFAKMILLAADEQQKCLMHPLDENSGGLLEFIDPSNTNEHLGLASVEGLLPNLEFSPFSNENDVRPLLTTESNVSNKQNIEEKPRRRGVNEKESDSHGMLSDSVFGSDIHPGKINNNNNNNIPNEGGSSCENENRNNSNGNTDPEMESKSTWDPDTPNVSFSLDFTNPENNDGVPESDTLGDGNRPEGTGLIDEFKLVQSDGTCFYIKTDFFHKLHNALYPLTVIAQEMSRDLTTLVTLLGILEYFLREYAPFTPCCMFILIFLVIIAIKVITMLHKMSRKYPPEWRIHIREMVHHFYSHIWAIKRRFGARRRRLVQPRNIESAIKPAVIIPPLPRVTLVDDNDPTPKFNPRPDPQVIVVNPKKDADPKTPSDPIKPKDKQTTIITHPKGDVIPQKTPTRDVLPKTIPTRELTPPANPTRTTTNPIRDVGPQTKPIREVTPPKSPTGNLVPKRYPVPDTTPQTKPTTVPVKTVPDNLPKAKEEDAKPSREPIRVTLPGDRSNTTGSREFNRTVSETHSEGDGYQFKSKEIKQRTRIRMNREVVTHSPSAPQLRLYKHFE
ncbi:unnamed protein product, partial [Owenia fusiformis]